MKTITNSFEMRILLIMLTFLTLNSYSQHLPDYILRTPVFVELDNGGSGSGFYVQDSLHTYFVTARHVIIEKILITKKTKKDSIFLTSRKIYCFSYPKDPNIGERRKLSIDLVEALNKGFLKYEKNNDISIIQISNNSKANDSLSLIQYYPFIEKDKSSHIEAIPVEAFIKYDEVNAGDDVYVFGYPTSIGIQESPQFDYQRPLLRKGVIAGKYERQKTIIIDCPSYYGNSGGPVIVKYLSGDGIFYRLIGIISEFIPYKEDWINSKNGLINTNVANSGYSVVTPIGSILQLMKK